MRTDRHDARRRWASRALAALGIAAVACAPKQERTPAAASEVPTSGWIDATATLDPATTPVYEGDAPMKFDFLKDMRQGDGLTLSVLSLGAHSGTHVDAPMHFVSGGASVDRVPLEPLIGPARVIDIADGVQAIDAAELERHEWRGAPRVLFRTRSSLRGWMASPTFHRDFAYIAPDAAQLLADAGVQLVGIDYISAEQFGAPEPRAHRILLGKGIPIVEGLALADVRAGEYDLFVLPIKVGGHEGAPARAVLRPRAPAAASRGAAVFGDEFSGAALDRAKWTVYTGEVYNEELQRYVDRAENLYVAHGADAEGASDGALVIRARYEPGVGFKAKRSEFTSGRLHGKSSFRYGTATARMKLPAGSGLWPAFWLLGGGDWPASGEIDVMENVGDPAWVSVALHGPGYSGDTPLVRRDTLAPGATAWHEYAVTWAADSIVFRVDGAPVYRVTRADVARYGPPGALDSAKFVILNLALGGGYPAAVNNVRSPRLGLPDSTVERIRRGEAKVLVDWVRVTR